MKSTKKLAAEIARKKSIMKQELNPLLLDNLPDKPGGMVCHLFRGGEGKSSPYSKYEGNKIVRSQSTKEMANEIDKHIKDLVIIDPISGQSATL